MSYDDQDWFQYEYEELKRRKNPWEDYQPPPTEKKSSQKPKSQKGKCKYALHPDPSFDPHEYLLAEEIRNRTIPDKYSLQLRKYRFGLYGFTFTLRKTYTVLVETMRKSCQVEDSSEDGFAFLRFIKYFVVNLYVFDSMSL